MRKDPSRKAILLFITLSQIKLARLRQKGMIGGRNIQETEEKNSMKK
jgi:hypothetical protein